MLNLPQFSIALVKCTFRLSLLHNCKTSGLVLIRDHRSNAYKLILSLHWQYLRWNDLRNPLYFLWDLLSLRQQQFLSIYPNFAQHVVPHPKSVLPHWAKLWQFGISWFWADHVGFLLLVVLNARQILGLTAWSMLSTWPSHRINDILKIVLLFPFLINYDHLWTSCKIITTLIYKSWITTNPGKLSNSNFIAEPTTIVLSLVHFTNIMGKSLFTIFFPFARRFNIDHYRLLQNKLGLLATVICAI